MGDPSPALPRLGQIALNGLGIIVVTCQQSSQVLEHQNLLQFLAVCSKLRLEGKLGVSCHPMLSLPCANLCVLGRYCEQCDGNSARKKSWCIESQNLMPLATDKYGRNIF